MKIGEVVALRNFTAYERTDNLNAAFTFGAPGKAKGKHTKNMLFMYCGLEDIASPVTPDEIKARLGDLGWREMTDDEYQKHVENRK